MVGGKVGGMGGRCGCVYLAGSFLIGDFCFRGGGLG